MIDLLLIVGILDLNLAVIWVASLILSDYESKFDLLYIKVEFDSMQDYLTFGHLWLSMKGL